MSALPSPVTSTTSRGKVSLLLQPPALVPKSESRNVGDAKCPPPVASATYTPSAPKPTMSAMPSKFPSASLSGSASLLLLLPPFTPHATTSHTHTTHSTFHI